MNERCRRQPTYVERVSALSADGATLVDRMFYRLPDLAVCESVYYEIVGDQVWELHHTTGRKEMLRVIAQDPTHGQPMEYIFDKDQRLNRYTLSAITPPDYPSQEKLEARPESAPPSRFDQMTEGLVEEYLESLSLLQYTEALCVRLGDNDGEDMYSNLVFGRVETSEAQTHSFDLTTLVRTPDGQLPIACKSWGFAEGDISLTLTSDSIEMDGLLGMNDEQRLSFQKEGVDYLRMLHQSMRHD